MHVDTLTAAILSLLSLSSNHIFTLDHIVALLAQPLQKECMIMSACWRSTAAKERGTIFASRT